jgi:hypothetical protein
MQLIVILFALRSLLFSQILQLHLVNEYLNSLEVLTIFHTIGGMISVFTPDDDTAIKVSNALMMFINIFGGYYLKSG